MSYQVICYVCNEPVKSNEPMHLLLDEPLYHYAFGWFTHTGKCYNKHLEIEKEVRDIEKNNPFLPPLKGIDGMIQDIEGDD